MMRLRGYALLLAGLLAVGGAMTTSPLAHAAGTQTFTIRVTGPHHLRFSGALDAMSADGSSDNHSVSGRATTTYSERGVMVAVEIQKEDDNGDQLRVSIYDGRRLVKSGSTRAAFGIVSLSTPLSF